MENELISTGKTVEAALQSAAGQLGIEADQLEYEVIAEAKKGFLGIGEVPAKVRIFLPKEEEEANESDAAERFIDTLLANMDIHAEVQVENGEDGSKEIRIYGDEASVLIGHHGDTLEALQYLVNLAANKRAKEEEKKEYIRIHMDIEDYRARRADTLRALARRMADKVQRYGRSMALEPMPAYERRIIHAELQQVEGITTHSIGNESNRRVVISKKK
ncbi:MAG: protein jag [Clostridiales bacterium]|nr:protein jag [Clostridiales bacterium]